MRLFVVTETSVLRSREVQYTKPGVFTFQVLFFEINAKLETFEIVFAEWVEKIRYGEKLQKIRGGGNTSPGDF